MQSRGRYQMPQAFKGLPVDAAVQVTELDWIGGGLHATVTEYLFPLQFGHRSFRRRTLKPLDLFSVPGWICRLLGLVSPSSISRITRLSIHEKSASINLLCIVYSGMLETNDMIIVGDKLSLGAGENSTRR